MNRVRGWEPLDFGDAIAAEPERMAPNNPNRRRDRHQSYLERGRYLTQLQRVCQFYPREALMVLLYEDLRDAPLETYQSVCRFLQISDTFTPPNLGRVFNPYVSFRSLKLRKISRRIAVGHLKPLRRVIDRRNERTRTPYPPMDPLLRAELQRQFAEDNAALAAWLGRDLSHWNRQPVTTGEVRPAVGTPTWLQRQGKR
jgi:hypothetical protein